MHGGPHGGPRGGRGVGPHGPGGHRPPPPHRPRGCLCCCLPVLGVVSGIAALITLLVIFL